MNQEAYHPPYIPSNEATAASLLVYAPGAPSQVDNIYPTWDGLWAAFNLTTGPVTLMVTTKDGPTALSPGTFDFGDRLQRVIGCDCNISAPTFQRTIFTIPDGTFLKKIRTWEGIELIDENDGAIGLVNDATFELIDSTVTSMDPNVDPMLRSHAVGFNTNEAVVVISGTSSIETGNHEAIHANLMILIALGACRIEEDSISSANVILNRVSSVRLFNQANAIIGSENLYDKADDMGYAIADISHWLADPERVKPALDELAARLFAVEEYNPNTNKTIAYTDLNSNDVFENAVPYRVLLGKHAMRNKLLTIGSPFDGPGITDVTIELGILGKTERHMGARSIKGITGNFSIFPFSTPDLFATDETTFFTIRTVGAFHSALTSGSLTFIDTDENLEAS